MSSQEQAPTKPYITGIVDSWWWAPPRKAWRRPSQEPRAERAAPPRPRAMSVGTAPLHDLDPCVGFRAVGVLAERGESGRSG